MQPIFPHHVLLSCLLTLVINNLDRQLLPAQSYKQLPPKGISICDSSRLVLTKRVRDLSVRSQLLSKSVGTNWIGDVDVLIRAVDLALTEDGFYREKDVDAANKLLDQAERRLASLATGSSGLQLLGLTEKVIDSPMPLAGGFRSRLDDSIQPYGIVLPVGYQPDSEIPYRLDVWLHGRGDNKTEIAFLAERLERVGQYAPKNTLVLHPFGRHCNAFKFAGETDVNEAIEHLKKIANIDSSKISIRGFSMGGAGCWHMAVHQPANWFAANPGAGFVDTLIYQGWKEETPFAITPTQQKLLNWYDVLPWVGNLRNVPTVAYSGELDKQRQAADRVVEQAEKSEIPVTHIIGRNMGHKIDTDSALKIEGSLNRLASEPNESPRREINFTTCTLRYWKADWLEITGLKEHWIFSQARARITDNQQIVISTEGITRLKLNFRDSGWPQLSQKIQVVIDGELIEVSDRNVAPGLQVEFIKREQWQELNEVDTSLRKRPGLQGPIDDAFCDRFLFVAPSEFNGHDATQKWIEREFEYAKHRWRTLMRGDIRVVQDIDLTESMIKENHLICFGDFTGNLFLKKIKSDLPIRWDQESISLPSHRFDADTHVATLCYPNPANPDKYLVINSGMTFREFSNVSNSRQIAMLPDWAILRTDSTVTDIFAGEKVLEGFFDEQWQWKQ